MKLLPERHGFSLIDLLLIIAALAGIFLVVLPQFARSHTPASGASCTNNLKQVGLAFRLWAEDNQDKFPTEISVTNGGAMEAVLAGDVAMVFKVVSNELNTPKILFCPTEKRRIQATTFALVPQTNGNTGGIPFVGNTNITYFVGLDTTTNLPSTFLSGDDNILVSGVAAKRGILSLKSNTPTSWSNDRHKQQGNVGLVDGSVQGFSTAALRTALANTGIETNRLAMP